MAQETNMVDESTRWEQIDCPVCGSSAFEHLFKKRGEPFVRCKECGLVLINPRPVYTEHVVNTYDEDYSSHYMSKAKKKVRRFTKWVKRVQRFGKKKGRWLDVGCANGVFVREAIALGIDSEGIELSEVAADQARAGDIQDDLHVIPRTLNLDLVNAGVSVLRPLGVILNEPANLLVFDQERGIVLLGRIPATLPTLHDADAKTDRIDFLSHNSISLVQFAGTTVSCWTCDCSTFVYSLHNGQA